MMGNLGRISKRYNNLTFLFAVSNYHVADELKSMLEDFKNKYCIYVANTTSSNALRAYSKMAKTRYVYFHDCDDFADYDLLNDIFDEVNIGDDIYCFNVLKKFYGANNEIISNDKHLFKIPQGAINNICNLPTCVYSKIIPTKYLHVIEFPNLPYTQDWAISYQLYPLAKHIFDERISYIYNNYIGSSSHTNNDYLYRINRVAVYSKSLIKHLRQTLGKYEADFLSAKYNDTLFYRYRKLGIRIRPYTPSIRLFIRGNNRLRLSLIYRYIHKNITLIG